MIGTLAAAKPAQAARLGEYEILDRLAAGGMAELFLARVVGPQGFQKLVVLKRILPQLADTARYVRLLLDEARLGAHLQHPNIAQVFDLGLVDGQYCYAMEYVHGCDLRAVFERATAARVVFPVDHAVRIASELAAALHHAHECRGPQGEPLNIVHRDVSPSNVLISYDGAVKLVDFGVAKADTSSIQTPSGALKGKSGYMSPEQAQRAPVDRRTDVYALGIVLWEMLTGARLYDAANALGTSELVLSRLPQPPSTVRPRRDCPADLDAIVMRALAHSLEVRFQTARQLQVELEKLGRAHRLERSGLALGDFMHELFSAEVSAAQRTAASTTRTDLVAVPMSSFSEPGESWLSNAPTDVRVADSMQSEAPTRPAPGAASLVSEAPTRVFRTARIRAQVPLQLQHVAAFGLAALALAFAITMALRSCASESTPTVLPDVAPLAPAVREPVSSPPSVRPRNPVRDDSAPSRRPGRRRDR
jgi:eukaryotic-like serine/threonine-protein kinase